jgi:pimeloyl-ACP methyl ester carboxylesterase
MRPLIVAIHGILTGQTSPSWPDRLDAMFFSRAPQFKVIKKEYRAGPFPRWNCLVRSPHLAHGLAEELALFLPGNGYPASGADSPIWFVAHSNGAVIALHTARHLIERGYGIAGLILLGAACPADIEQNSVLEWLSQGRLGTAVAFCTRTDRVLARFGTSATPPGRTPARRSLLQSVAQRLWSLLIWPYGALGSTGWLLNSQPAGRQYIMGRSAIKLAREREPLVTYWYRGGHSTFFSGGHLWITVDLIREIIAARANGPAKAGMSKPATTKSVS